MQLIFDKNCATFLRQSQKTVAGIGTPQLTRRPNRANSARFFYGFGRSGPLRRAAPCGGSSNSVRPAHPRLEPWQADVAERTRRSVMTKPNTQAYYVRRSLPQRELLTPCAPEMIARGHINCALDRAVQLVDRHGTIFLPVHGYLYQALAALDEFDRTMQQDEAE